MISQEMEGTTMTADQNSNAPKTMSVPEAGRLFYDLGKNGSYAAAQRGEIVTIRVGRLLRVPVAAMERKLEEVGRENA